MMSETMHRSALNKVFLYSKLCYKIRDRFLLYLFGKIFYKGAFSYENTRKDLALDSDCN